MYNNINDTGVNALYNRIDREVSEDEVLKKLISGIEIELIIET